MVNGRLPAPTRRTSDEHKAKQEQSAETWHPEPAFEDTTPVFDAWPQAGNDQAKHIAEEVIERLAG
jgi:hypothetical protein